MKLEMVCIFDKRAMNYGAPMAFPTLGVAQRSFADSVNEPNSAMNKHPEDYSLVHIGSFDTSTGYMTNHDLGTDQMATAEQVLIQPKK